MPKSERDETLALLTARIFSAMVNDLVMDATLQSHHEVARSRAVCRVCHTHCGLAHAPGSSTSTNQINMSPSRPGTPASVNDAKANGSSGTGTNTPTSVKDGNLYLDCVNCSRQIASNRYAPHLSQCMGLSSARRGAARGTNKSKQPSDLGRSASPESDAGHASDDSSNQKGKGKSMTKRADEAEFNLKRKRPVSPQVSPAKNQKKQKTSGSPVSRLKADPTTSKAKNHTYHPPSLSQSKVPSKLRDSSTASFIGGSSNSDSSRASSPGVTLASSFHNQKSATRPIANKSKATGIVPLPKRPSPPRPPPLHVTDYTIDVEGEETGSSTDTDSS